MNFFRKTIFFLGVLSILAACGSFVSQYVLGMDPCVLCILQRLSVLAVGLVALAAAFFRQASKIGRLFSALLVSVPAVYGGSAGDYADDPGDGDFRLADPGMDCGAGRGLSV